MLSKPSTGPMNILFLAQLPPPIHGVTRMSKHVFDLLGLKPNVHVTQMWAGSARSLDDVGTRTLSKYFDFAKLLSQLSWRVITGQRSHIAYVTIAPHGEALFRDALAIYFAGLLGDRVLVHTHTRGLDEVIAGNTFVQRFTKWALKGTELVTQSKTISVELKNHALFSEIHHLPNFVNDPGTPDVSVKSKLKLGFFGSMDHRKGVLRFVDVLIKLKKAGIAFEAKIAGRDAPNMTQAKVAEYAKEHGVLDDIHMPGFLKDDDAIAEFLSDLDLFVYPTKHDLAPLVLLEALAHGTAPIAFDTGSISEMLSPEFSDHVISDTSNPDVYYPAMVTQIAHYDSNREELIARKKMARACFLNRHSKESFKQNLYDIVAIQPAEPYASDVDIQPPSNVGLRERTTS